MRWLAPNGTKHQPIIGTDPDGKEYLFPNKNAALDFVCGRRAGSYERKQLEEKKKIKGWTFRYLNENEIIYYYEKILCKPGWEKYGTDPRPESGTSNSGE